MSDRQPFDNGYLPTKDYPEYIDHYFYFPQSPEAERAAVQLRRRGWSTEVRLGADGANWLALSTQPATGDEDMGPIWEELTAFAARFGGVYDGWERPMDEPESVN
jgi:hypothetical protein